MRVAGLKRKWRLVKRVDCIVQRMRFRVFPMSVAPATWVPDNGTYTYVKSLYTVPMI